MSFPTAFTGHVLPRDYRQFEDGAPAAPLSLAGQGVIRYNDTTKTFQVSIDGGAYINVATGAGAGPWDRTGTIVHLDFAADTVAMGAAAMSGTGEKVRMLSTPIAAAATLRVEPSGQAAASTGIHVERVRTGALGAGAGLFGHTVQLNGDVGDPGSAALVAYSATVVKNGSAALACGMRLFGSATDDFDRTIDCTNTPLVLSTFSGFVGVANDISLLAAAGFGAGPSPGSDINLTPGAGVGAVDGAVVVDGTMRMLDDRQLRFGTADDITEAWLNATNDWLHNNTVATGSTIFRLGTATTATDYQVQDNALSALLTVDGSGIVTVRTRLDVGASMTVTATSILCQTPLFTSFGGSFNEQTLAGPKTLVIADAAEQLLDPDGATRVVTLPALASSDGLPIWIHNTGTDAADILDVQNPAAATVETIPAGTAAKFKGDGAKWVSLGVWGAPGGGAVEFAHATQAGNLTLTNATLGTDTTDLSIDLPTNGDWFISTHYLWDCGVGSVEGLKCDYTLTGATASFARRMSTAFNAQLPSFNAAEQNGSITGDFNVVGVSGQIFIANDYMVITVSSAPGTLLFRAAKNTEVGGADTTFLSGSFITAIKKAA